MAEQALLCPSCQKRFRVRSYEARETYKCPECKTRLEPTSEVDASAQTIITDAPRLTSRSSAVILDSVAT